MLKRLIIIMTTSINLIGAELIQPIEQTLDRNVKSAFYLGFIGCLSFPSLALAETSINGITPRAYLFSIAGIVSLCTCVSAGFCARPAARILRNIRISLLSANEGERRPLNQAEQIV